jgi:hypothetical protein
MASPLDRAADLLKGDFYKFPHRMRLASCEDIIVGLRLLQDEPHALNEVARVTPVTFSVQVTEVKPLLQTILDGRDGAGNLSRHERLAAERTLVVKKDAIRCM